MPKKKKKPTPHDIAQQINDIFDNTLDTAFIIDVWRSLGNDKQRTIDYFVQPEEFENSIPVVKVQSPKKAWGMQMNNALN